MWDKLFSHLLTFSRNGPTKRDAVMLCKFIALSSSICRISSTAPSMKPENHKKRKNLYQGCLVILLQRQIRLSKLIESFSRRECSRFTCIISLSFGVGDELHLFSQKLDKSKSSTQGVYQILNTGFPDFFLIFPDSPLTFFSTFFCGIYALKTLKIQNV